MAKRSKEAAGCSLNWVDDFAGQPRHLLRAAALYLTAVVVLCCVPTCFYDRISETGQAVVLTLVDTAAAELQNLAEPSKINPEFPRGKALPKNASLVVKNANIGQKLEEDPEETSTSTQIPSPPVADEITESLNETESLGEEVLLIQDSIDEEAPEVVVVVRAEHVPISSDGAELKVEDEVEIFPDEVPKVEDSFTTAPELNDTAARTRLISGTRDEAAAPILGDGIVATGPTDPHEDIPSFNEWAQKRLEEAEKKKTHPNASVQSPGGVGRGVGGIKVRSKNYASPDCGAKIVAVNPEARSARSVLASTRDEYMLNTCTSRIWFVVELCEAIQAKKIELANFELFSSSPKDFSVYVSDRFPTRDWSPVGQFTAKDTKDTQSFTLHPHLFGKFIKVELQTYYGSEHFCPISLFRAYGTSEFEVLETETENQVSRESSPGADDEDDSDEEEGLDAEGGTPPRNLFGSARDAVLSIVKKAAEVLVKSSDLTGNNITEIQQSIDGGNLENSYISCTTPRHTILCENCSDHKFAKVFQLVSCRQRQLDQLLRINFVNETLRQGGLCKIHGVETETFTKLAEKNGVADPKERHDERRTTVEPLKVAFLSSVFNSEYIVALCNVLATKDRKVVTNTSYEISLSDLATEDVVKEDLSITKTVDHSADATGSFQHVSPTCTSSSSSASCRTTASQEPLHTREPVSEVAEETSGVSIEASSGTDSVASQIKPVKTLGKEDAKKESLFLPTESKKDPAEDKLQVEVSTIPPSSSTASHQAPKVSEEPSTPGTTETASPSSISDSVPAMNIEESSNDEILEVEPVDAIGVQSKVEKQEQPDAEKKPERIDVGEQEIKLPHQDLAFDTLLSDLKDFEGEAANYQSGPAAVSMTQPTSTTPQKESVFLRLSNRIKALERNMSLSGQYLEELSRRYKKQVEEMQRSLERAVSSMGEESRKVEERDVKRLEEISILREEIASLSKSVESLLYDRDSWHSRFSVIGQHALLICFEILVVILILSYCRRPGRREEERKQQPASKKDPVRRKSAENFGSHSKKAKKRRPSEVVSHITGTYRELMIEDRCQESKKEKKRKRKKEAACHKLLNNGSKEDAIVRYKSVPNVVVADTTLPSRRASSVDAPKTSDLRHPDLGNPESDPESPVDHFCLEVQGKERVVELTSFGDKFSESEKSSEFSNSCVGDLSDSNSSAITDRVGGCVSASRNEAETPELPANMKNKSGILKGAKLSSSSFMKTALGSRKKRKVSNVGNSELGRNSVNSADKSAEETSEAFRATVDATNVNSNTNGGLIDESDESRSSTATPTSEKKEKKSTGLKKMVRKLF